MPFSLEKEGDPDRPTLLRAVGPVWVARSAYQAAKLYRRGERRFSLRWPAQTTKRQPLRPGISSPVTENKPTSRGGLDLDGRKSGPAAREGAGPQDVDATWAEAPPHFCRKEEVRQTLSVNEIFDEPIASETRLDLKSLRNTEL
jgi:hypothetical protein